MRLRDDVPEEVKQRRLSEVIETFHATARARAPHEVGRTHVVLVEGVRIGCVCVLCASVFGFWCGSSSDSALQKSRRSSEEWSGRSDTNKKVIFPAKPADAPVKVGDYVLVQVDSATPVSLRGTMLGMSPGPALPVV